MKRLFSIFAILSLAVGFTACETTTPDVNEPENHVVVLSGNKQEIVADGTDSVTFTVTVDGVNMSSDVQIINLNDNSVLEGANGAKFSTTAAGEYRFMAVYKSNFTSEAVTVVAKSVNNDDEGSDDTEDTEGSDDEGSDDTDDPD